MPTVTKTSLCSGQSTRRQAVVLEQKKTLAYYQYRIYSSNAFIVKNVDLTVLCQLQVKAGKQSKQHPKQQKAAPDANASAASTSSSASQAASHQSPASQPAVASSSASSSAAGGAPAANGQSPVKKEGKKKDGGGSGGSKKADDRPADISRYIGTFFGAQLPTT